MDDSPKYISGRSYHTIQVTVSDDFLSGIRAEVAANQFVSTNEFLHRIADLTNNPRLKDLANAGHGAYAVNYQIGSIIQNGDLTTTIVETDLKFRLGPGNVAAVRIEPPAAAVKAALAAAAKSPCQKSQRGATLFHPFTGTICPATCNGRPDGQCDLHRCGGDICRRVCVHAESRALRIALDAEARAGFVADGDFAFSIHDCELVHVKLKDSVHVPVDGPSCLPCATELVDVGIFGVWLYLERGWMFYPIAEFYQRTLAACQINLTDP